MSPLDRPIPPSGEEIHIPGPSLHPVLLTLGVTMIVVGITIFWIIAVAGGILTLAVLVAWIRGARGEYDELPLDHSAH